MSLLNQSKSFARTLNRFQNTTFLSTFNKPNGREVNPQSFLAPSGNIMQLKCRQKYTNVDHIPTFYDRYVFPEPPEMVSDEEHKNVIAKVNECISSPECGRLFAVVQVSSHQYKITDHDLIRTVGQVSAELGQTIRLEKVLCVGGKNFTLAGRPLVRRDLVRIEATVIEHTPAVVKVLQSFRRRRHFEKRKFYTPIHSVLRINSIQAFPNLL